MLSYAERQLVFRLIDLALDEDLGRKGDLTSQAIFQPTDKGHARLIAREPGCFSGLDIARLLIERFDPAIILTDHIADGQSFKAGDNLLEMQGAIISLLSIERPLLNFTSHLSGIATQTARFIKAMGDSPARLLCTRKTTPGFRLLEKAAVRHGGGHNHRFGLDDGYLVKDNHIAAAGSITSTIQRIKNEQHHFIAIECEVDRLDQIDEAIQAGATMILLDNMPPAQIRQALALIDGRAKTEASGGITLETVADIAATGVDFISSGALTKGAPTIDFGLDWG